MSELVISLAVIFVIFGVPLTITYTVFSILKRNRRFEIGKKAIVNIDSNTSSGVVVDKRYFGAFVEYAVSTTIEEYDYESKEKNSKNVVRWFSPLNLIRFVEDIDYDS